MTGMLIITNSSKTMLPAATTATRAPDFLAEARLLDALLKQRSPLQLKRLMHISPALALKTHEHIQVWGTTDPTPALDTFQGDIYRGLEAHAMSQADRAYADVHLRILSGLYGVLRPLDGVELYRLELGYKLSGRGFKNLYDFWGDRVARALPTTDVLVQLASQEYYRLIQPYVDASTVIEPQFLSIMPGASDHSFVAFHAKVARGAFASWMIRERIAESAQMIDFTELGYRYDGAMSTSSRPTFVKDMR